jgi:hypothetical protein
MYENRIFKRDASDGEIIGGKLLAIIGVYGEVKFNVDMNKFTSTLEEMSKVIKP